MPRFEYQRIDPYDPYGNQGGFNLEMEEDTQTWTLKSGTVPGILPREYTKTTAREWERFWVIKETTSIDDWNERPTYDEVSRVDRVWCLSGSTAQGYVELYGTGCDHRLKDIAAIVPGLAKIEELVRACDLQLDGVYAEEAPNPYLETLEKIEERRLLAEAGDLDVICARGLDLLTAPPQYRDYEEGMRYLRKASDAGLSLATYNIGVMLRDGYSGEKDLVGALRYFDQAAAGGYPMAKRNAGLMRINGEGCPEDFAEGYRMLFEAAKIGDYTSLVVIGRITSLMVKDAKFVKTGGLTGGDLSAVLSGALAELQWPEGRAGDWAIRWTHQDW